MGSPPQRIIGPTLQVPAIVPRWYLAPLLVPLENPLTTRDLQPPKKKKPRTPPEAGSSKLAKELGLSSDEETEILEAWNMFVDSEASEDFGEEVIPRVDVRRVLM
jgi:hypothetical protein